MYTVRIEVSLRIEPKARSNALIMSFELDHCLIHISKQFFFFKTKLKTHSTISLVQAARQPSNRRSFFKALSKACKKGFYVSRKKRPLIKNI